MQFTIYFNKDIPTHKKVAEMLNNAGRNKAKMIAEAFAIAYDFEVTVKSGNTQAQETIVDETPKYGSAKAENAEVSQTISESTEGLPSSKEKSTQLNKNLLSGLSKMNPEN